MQSKNNVAYVVAIIVLLAGQVVGCAKPDTVRTVFTVEGMHCTACSSTITVTLERVDGVVEASADYETGIAEAVYRPQTVGAEELKAEIEQLGYTVTAMQTEAVDG